MSEPIRLRTWEERARRAENRVAELNAELTESWRDTARHRIAVHLLYAAHKEVNFDTPEDSALQDRVLIQAEDILGYDPIEAFGDAS